MSRPPKESESEVAQSCLTLCNPKQCSLPGFCDHGIFQAGVLEWAAISSSRESSQPSDKNPGLLIADRRFRLSHQGSSGHHIWKSIEGVYVVHFVLLVYLILSSRRHVHIRKKIFSQLNAFAIVSLLYLVSKPSKQCSPRKVDIP